MNINEIHFMREILVTDHRGNAIPTMQVSESNEFCLRPVFKEVAFYDRESASALYAELGGGRSEGERIGSTVIIPNRSLWASLWRISPAEVRVIPSGDLTTLSAGTQNARQEKARQPK